MRANGVTKSFYKISFLFKKHSPEIFIVAGIVGTVVSTVMACKATPKAKEVIEDYRDEINEIQESVEEHSEDEDYILEERKSVTKARAQTGLTLIKLYAPSVIIGGLSITGILSGYHIFRKRYIALAAAYATLDQCFKEYRSRVVDRYGEGVDRELRYDIKKQTVYKKEIDEKTGQTKNVKKEVEVIDPHVSEFARFFGPYKIDENGDKVPNNNWQNQMDYNLLFLKNAERYFDELLRIKGRIFLNEVYDYLDLPRSKAGQIVGWEFRPRDEYHVGDNYIDFGPYETNIVNTDEEDGYCPAILLDFNVDGNVWDSMFDYN